MPDASGDSPFTAKIEKLSSGIWHCIGFLVHLAIIYIVVRTLSPALAGWIQRTFIPLWELSSPPSSGMELLFNHLFVLSFIPAFLASLVCFRFRIRAAQYVWLGPAALLCFKFVTFAPTNGMESRFPAALHYYFASGFTFPDYHSWREFWSVVESHPDLLRGLAQTQYTAPFYAGVGYSFASWIRARTGIDLKIAQRLKAWEESRFGTRDQEIIEKS